MKPKQTNLTVFAILTTLTLITWAAVEAYVRFYRVDLSSVPEKISSPLTPSLDTAVLNDLEQKVQLSEEELLLYSPNIAPIVPVEDIPSIPVSTASPEQSTESGTESAVESTPSAESGGVQ